MVEGVHGRLGMLQQQGALAEVVEREGGQAHREPRELDGAVAEVAQVRVQCFAARDHQEDRPQHHEPAAHVLAEEPDRVIRRHRAQYGRILHDLYQAEHRDDRKPQHHDGPEYRTDPRGALALEVKQADENHDREWNHQPREQRRGHLQAFHRAHHRDRRREGAVGVNQRGAEDAEDDHDLAGRQPAGHAVALHQRHQGEHAAFTLVVGADDDDVILDGHDEDERPEHQRQDAQDVARGDGDAERAVERLAHGVQRAGPDVAVDHSQRGDRQADEIPPARLPAR